MKNWIIILKGDSWEISVPHISARALDLEVKIQCWHVISRNINLFALWALVLLLLYTICDWLFIRFITSYMPSSCELLNINSMAAAQDFNWVQDFKHE